MSSPIRPGQAKGPSVGLDTGSGGPGTIETYDEGVLVDAATAKMDFAGAGVTVTNPVAGRALVTIPGAGAEPVTTATGLVASVDQSQAGALALTAYFNEVATVANPYDAVRLKPAVLGFTQVVTNIGANAMTIWPAVGEGIGVKPTNGTIILQPFQTYHFRATNTGHWTYDNLMNEHVWHSHVMQQQTTDATETRMQWGDFHLADDCLYNFEIALIGMETNSDELFSARAFFTAYRKNGGDVTMLGNLNVIMQDRTNNALTFDVRKSTAAGGAVGTYVTGLAGKTIDWTAYISALRMREL